MLMSKLQSLPTHHKWMQPQPTNLEEVKDTVEIEDVEEVDTKLRIEEEA